MNEIQEQKELTQKEIQEWADRVYDFAVDLYTNQNMNWREVRQELINQGLSPEDASVVVSNLQKQERQAKNDVANKELGYGALWAVGGVALTALTGGYLIFYGAVLWGGWLILKGIWHKIS